MKCGEEKPECLNCQRQGEACDYSIRLNWDGRTKRKADSGTPEPAGLTPHSRVSRVSGAITSTTAFPTSTVEDGPTELSPKGPEKHSNVIPGQPEGKDQDKELPTRQYVDSSPAVSQRQSTFQSTNHHASTTASPTKARTVGHEPAGHENARQKSGRANNPGNKEAEHSFSEERTRASLYTTYGGPFTLSPPLRKALGDCGIYPSPVISNHESPALDDRLTLKQSPKPQPASTAHMLPPYHMPVSNTRSLNRKDRDYTLSPQNTSKRIKLSPLIGSANAGQGFDNRAYDTSSRYQEQSKQTFAIPLPPRSPYGSNMGTPLTPASSSTTSEDVNQRLPLEGSPYISRGSPDLRRLSVHSLLSGPPEGDGPRTATHAEQFTTISPYPVRDYSTNTIDYGIDRGFPDLDVSRNDDMHALNGVSPALVNDDREFMAQNHFGNGYYVPTEFGFGLQAKNTAFGEGGYYAKPVPVKIPRSLEPLPPTLLQNPMNLLYFHHFLNHTARILVPHDCSENPFRKILPRSTALKPLLQQTTNVNSGPGKHQPPQPSPSLFGKPSSTSSQPTRTRKSYRSLGPRRLSSPPSSTRR